MLNEDMTFAKVVDGKVKDWPLTVADIQRLHRFLSFPDGKAIVNACKSLGYELVEPTPRPPYDPTVYEVLETLPFVSRTGVVQQVWSMVPVDTDIVRRMRRSEREDRVKKLTVTTSTGRVFCADETSQIRILLAITSMKALGEKTRTWILNDNRRVEVGLSELIEALALASRAFGTEWLAP